ncbi:MAG TPA: sulfatase-like hydrolase/transferase [Steroidobacteraceae bacterium]|nr:sulfatase-like hydrolase/transferase [Steroidobacteraceae bacterium]
MRSRQFLFDFLALSLILIAPFVILLGHHGYAYSKPEVVLIFAVTTTAAAVLALVVGLTAQWMRIAVLALLLALFIDVHVTLPRLSAILILLLYLATAAVLGLLLWVLREHATKILTVTFVTLIALTIFTADPSPNRVSHEAKSTATSAGDAPLFIHLLLDEHIGVEGLPREIHGARELRAELIRFYTEHGFRLFGGAYSQYANTFDAVPNLLNFASRDVSRVYLAPGSDEREWRLKESAYFKMLQDRGYRLHVYQSTYMELCHVRDVNPQSCTTYPVASLGTIQDLDLRAGEKARFVVSALLARSHTLRALDVAYRRLVRAPLARMGLSTPVWKADPPSFGPLPIPQMFERLTEDILQHPRGHAYFAHLIMPHYPYVYDSHCALRPRSEDWLTNHITSPDELVYNTQQSRERKYELYADQVRCALTMIDRLLDKLESRGLLEDATFIVNGDHGSRIPTHFPDGATLAGGVLTDSDYSDTFSTLYAIRKPGVEPGYVPEPALVVNLLDHHFAGEPLQQESSCRVFLVAKDGRSTLKTVNPRFCARNAVK